MHSKPKADVLAPLEPLLADPDVVEIMVNGYQQVYVERHGQYEDVPTPFHDDAHVLEVINAIIDPLGRKVNESFPMVDARLADGSRVNAVIPPIALKGPALTIRKFGRGHLTREDLLRFGSWNEDLIEFLEACVRAGLNILVTGGTATGKSCFLNVLAGMIPNDRRIITVENAAELDLPQKYVVTLESRPPNIEGRGAVTIQDLLINALRMRPDRIIVGEIRSSEALDLLQAINTGHNGCMTTMHGNNARDALSQLETIVTYHPMSLPVLTVRALIARAIDIVVELRRMRDGTRKVFKITEITGMEGHAIAMQDIFEFQETGEEEKRVVGRFKATGKIPQCLERIRAADVDLPLSLFTRGS
jgi:pilus assembly protein CpaF